MLPLPSDFRTVADTFLLHIIRIYESSLQVHWTCLLPNPGGIAFRCVCWFFRSFVRSLTSGHRLHWLAGDQHRSGVTGAWWRYRPTSAFSSFFMCICIHSESKSKPPSSYHNVIKHRHWQTVKTISLPYTVYSSFFSTVEWWLQLHWKKT